MRLLVLSCVTTVSRAHFAFQYIRNKAQIGHGKQQVMAKLIYTSLTKPSSSTASKQYAMKTLTYIASEVNNKMLVVDFEDGLILREAARLISDGSNFNTQVKISATELIGSLICRSTASKIACCHPRFLVTLASIGCGKENAAVSSARVVKKLSTFIHSDDNCHEDLLQALVTLSYGLQTKVLKLIMTAYAGESILDLLTKVVVSTSNQIRTTLIHTRTSQISSRQAENGCAKRSTRGTNNAFRRRQRCSSRSCFVCHKCFGL